VRSTIDPACHCTSIVAVVEQCHFLKTGNVPEAEESWKEGVDDNAITTKRILSSLLLSHRHPHLKYCKRGLHL